MPTGCLPVCLCLPVQAFVVFESPEEAQRACQKDRETFGDKFGDRYVRVYPTLESDVPDMQLAFQQQHMMQQVSTGVSCVGAQWLTDSIWQQGPGCQVGSPSPLGVTPAPRQLMSWCTAALPRCRASQGHSHMHLDSVVKMKSLPFDANQMDIIQFFEAYRLKPNGVQLVVRSDNKPTGEVRQQQQQRQQQSAADTGGVDRRSCLGCAQQTRTADAHSQASSDRRRSATSQWIAQQ